MKTLYVIACCLFLAAIVSDVTSKRHYATAAIGRAKSINLSDFERKTASDKSHAEVQIGTRFGITGMVAAGLGAAAWIASFTSGRRKGRRLTPVIPLILCVAYVMALLTII